MRPIKDRFHLKRIRNYKTKQVEMKQKQLDKRINKNFGNLKSVITKIIIKDIVDEVNSRMTMVKKRISVQEGSTEENIQNRKEKQI